jgi:Rab GDP dissociation inhibitor
MTSAFFPLRVFILCGHSDVARFRFVSITPLYIPTMSGKDDNIYITRSYDATSHFETVVDDVRDVYERVTGKELELKKRELEPDQQ